ncbi:type III secretion system stator protein SctL [Chromobacterium sphagni]|uniref:Uncharacterized protein n=1 Tax=Chromobacterium sphagni TaxID=1903179 RepID=A0ABX3CA70_9NEIS|nr:type III secretion system stator protein SctL [Chromobacterium sphagni]OHX19158.1 hypothetical protein BI344_19050 [Chromobacterium sphagni]
MTPLLLPITKLPGSAPLGPIIPASDLADYVQAGEIIARAQAQAKQIHDAAESEAERLHELCEQVLEAAWQNGLEKIAREVPGIRQQAVADAVEWLLDGRDLEHRIIERLEGRLRGILVDVFAECYGQQSEPQLLASLLRDRIGQLGDGVEGILYVCPEQHDEIRQTLGFCSRLRIEPDTSVVSGKALLQTPLVILSLDLDEQFNWAMNRLLSSGEKIWEKPDADLNNPRQGRLFLFPEDFSESRHDLMRKDATMNGVDTNSIETIGN